MTNTTSLSKERILVTGITGIHGWPVYRMLAQALRPDHLFGIGPPKMKTPSGKNITPICIADSVQLGQVRDTFHPTLVIHAAGVCDLDVCEERPLWAHRINVDGCRAVVDTFGQHSRICFLSTDLVFSGEHPPVGGYAEQHAADPVSIAGKTFLQGEQAIAASPHWSILRLGLPVGKSINGDKGGLDWVENRFRKNLPVTLFTDEYRSMLLCSDLARSVVEFIVSGTKGLYHLGGPKAISLHELGTMIIRSGNYSPALLRGITRAQEINGPPRIGNVALNSRKVAPLLSCMPDAVVLPSAKQASIYQLRDDKDPTVEI